MITVAFIGYLVAGMAGADARGRRHLPAGLLLHDPARALVPATPENPQLRAFVAGTTAAASGAIAGAVFVLGRRAVFDLPTAVIAVVGLALLWRFRVPEPLLVVAAGVSGLVLWPLFRG